jgi:dihydroorotate dehydrogenase (NAD+) catalytic subunit
MKRPNLKVEIGELEMKNPVMVASGTFGYGDVYKDIVPIDRLGGIVVKGITLRPKVGTPPPRIVETPCGMLNAIGMENIGVEAFIKEKLPPLREFDTKIIVNVCGERPEEYVEVVRWLDGESGVDGVEVNISCPNLQKGGMLFGQDPSLTYEVISMVRKATHLPLIAKLTPNVTDIRPIARAAVEGGADALSLINTVLGMAIDLDRKRPTLGNVTGGLSGPAIKPIALRMVYEVRGEVDVPLIGQGGIMDTRDAIEFIMTGATAVAIGTSNFVNPRSSLEVIEGIERYLIEEDIEDIAELIGVIRDGGSP